LGDYALALALVSTAFALRWGADPWLGDRVPFYLFIPAVLAAVWFCGMGPGLVAILAGLLLGDWFFAGPRGSLALQDRADQIAAGIYVLISLSLVPLVRWFRKKRRPERVAAPPKLSQEVMRWSAAGYERGKQNVLLVFMAAIAVLGVSLVFMFRAGQVSNAAVQQMTDDRLTLERLEQMLSTLTDAETGQRGYLLTGEDAYLEPYRKATREINSRLSELRDIASRGALPMDGVERLAQLVKEKMAELKQTIHLRQAGSLEAALSIVRGGAGRETMGNIRLEISRMKEGAEGRFWGAASRAHQARIARTMIYVMAGLVNLGFLAGAARKISRQMDETSRGRELLATTLASIGDGVIVTDDQGRVSFLNTEAERLTGWKSSESLGEPLRRIFNIINEHTREPIGNPVEQALRFGKVVGLANHTALRRRDGTEIPIDDSAAPIRQPGGDLFGAVVVFRDFTTQKQIEEQLEHTVQERTAKLREMVAELEHVSYAIVHDMRAPLRAMRAFAQMLQEEAGQEGPEQRREYAGRIIAAASRLDHLIQDALMYNRTVLQEVPLEPVDLSKLLKGLLETYPVLDPAKADFEIENSLPVVLGNEALLTQCFSNLLDNAVKFATPGTRPRVCIRAEPNQEFARIWIEDNGIGIAEPAQKRLFGLFQRLARGYAGTGAGLAIVRKVTERMGGRVGVESQSGKGSHFWVELRLGQTGHPGLPGGQNAAFSGKQKVQPEFSPGA